MTQKQEASTSNGFDFKQAAFAIATDCRQGLFKKAFETNQLLLADPEMAEKELTEPAVENFQALQNTFETHFDFDNGVRSAGHFYITQWALNNIAKNFKENGNGHTSLAGAYEEVVHVIESIQPNSYDGKNWDTPSKLTTTDQEEIQNMSTENKAREYDDNKHGVIYPPASGPVERPHVEDDIYDFSGNGSTISPNGPA